MRSSSTTRDKAIIACWLVLAGGMAHAAVGECAPEAGARALPGDPVAGEIFFQQGCAKCHTVVAGATTFGPSLAGVFGRISGTQPGYTYTPAMRNARVLWSRQELDEYLSGSVKKIPGTVMDMAVARAQDRENVIAYLASLGPLAAPAAQVRSAPLLRGPTQAELDHAGENPRDWLFVNKGYDGQRYVDLNQINVGNADQMRPVCIYRSGIGGQHQSTPVVYDGVLYVTTAEATLAVDAATCEEKWVHVYPITVAVIRKVSRGLAIGSGRVVRGMPDGHLIALNMSDGSLVWDRKVTGPERSEFFSGPPLIYDNKVIIGPAGSDWGAKGWVGAFRLDSGELVWRFNIVPDDGEPGAETWHDPKSRAHGGGALWTPMSLDKDRGILFLPTANPAPDFSPGQRPGDNLYTGSVVALDANSGKLLWFKQYLPNDALDWDLTQTSPLFTTTATAGGRRRDLMAVSGKDGLLRVLDRDTREQLLEVPVTRRENVTAIPDVRGKYVCPGPAGGVQWNSPAYHAPSNLLFVSAIEWCGTYKSANGEVEWTPGGEYIAGSFSAPLGAKPSSWLSAINATTGQIAWRRISQTPLLAGMTSTAGGVLFTGDMSNNFLALDAQTGRTLYSFNTGGSLGAGVISYAVRDRQYVAAVSGSVSEYFGGGRGDLAVIVFGVPVRGHERVGSAGAHRARPDATTRTSSATVFAGAAQ